MIKSRYTFFHRLSWVSLVFAFIVIILGAYVRLSDAGLGCPDWPGCYGHLDIPNEEYQIIADENGTVSYPHRLFEPAKAWKEMIHRYAAGTLGILILMLTVSAWRNRSYTEQPVILPLLLLALLLFQAMLGMWTVTLQLKPVVVMAHLLGGLATLSLLAWIVLRQGRYGEDTTPIVNYAMRNYALVGLLILVIQITLGAWTSANYASLACPDFPTCQGYWWPPTNFKEAFVIWHGNSVSYEGGVLNNDARVTIHLIHRIGALVVGLYISWLAWRLVTLSQSKIIKLSGLTMALLLTVQLALGIANVFLSLPMSVAVAHNGGAALLLLILVFINHLLRPVNKSL